MKKIGVIGSGQVARVLGKGLLKHGYEVMLGSRDTAKVADWAEGAAKAHAGTFEEAAIFGDLLLLAVKGTAAAEALEQSGVDNLKGKTIIDTCNPIADAPPEDGVIRYFTSLEDSLMEQLQARFPAAHFVKAFNSVGNAYMVNPEFKDGTPTMFICGDNEEAKSEVGKILDQFGWETCDMGKVTAARAIEPLCILWCIPGFLKNQWTHAFKLLRS